MSDPQRRLGPPRLSESQEGRTTTTGTERSASRPGTVSPVRLRHRRRTSWPRSPLSVRRRICRIPVSQSHEIVLAADRVELQGVEIGNLNRLAGFSQDLHRRIPHRTVERFRFFMGVDDQNIHRLETILSRRRRSEKGCETCEGSERQHFDIHYLMFDERQLF